MAVFAAVGVQMYIRSLSPAGYAVHLIRAPQAVDFICDPGEASFYLDVWEVFEVRLPYLLQEADRYRCEYNEAEAVFEVELEAEGVEGTWDVVGS